VMPSAREALLAVQQLNGTIWAGKKLVVQESHPQADSLHSAALCVVRPALGQHVLHITFTFLPKPRKTRV
jgi:hypothetical protein